LIRKKHFGNWLLCGAVLVSSALHAQNRASQTSVAQLRLHIASPKAEKHRAVPAVVWLEPVAGMSVLSFSPHGHYTLLQKNRTFVPHLQVIPVGAVVQFPNEDPFFHNVFSLFDGKRFDLGLYEAGSSKSVTFSRAGVSYIFCNIHPEMSAVVLALSTPLYAVADAEDTFVLRNIPPGNYNMHLWIEGVPQQVLDGLDRLVHLPPRTVDLGTLIVPAIPVGVVSHTNEFGKAYDSNSKPPYER
jgi:plastocyanin